jgi:hypothetical protein
MTAPSVSWVCTDSNTGDWSFSACPRVSVPSTGDAAAGSAVTMKNCSQPSACSKPAWPSAPIGRSAVPWKQK